MQSGNFKKALGFEKLPSFMEGASGKNSGSQKKHKNQLGKHTI